MTVTRPEILFETAEILCQSNNLQEVLRISARKAMDIFKADTVLISLINPQTHNTVKTVYRDGHSFRQDKYRVIHINVAGWVLKYDRPFITEDITRDKRFRARQFQKLNVKSVMAAPLKIAGRLRGCLVCINTSDNANFTENDLQNLARFNTIIAPYLHNIDTLTKYFETPIPDSSLFEKYQKAGLIGRSPAFRELLHSIEAAARSDVRVLLEGLTGTGKEVIARAIHTFSARNHGPFVAVDCGAIPQNLIESEMFGHIKGAFTGAIRDRQGLIESAQNGTLFLDEIASLPVDMQVKLMRFLQEGDIRAVGSNRTIHVDVRIIAASSSALRTLVDAGQFREDLYYRLMVYPIRVPSLEERRIDIPVLLLHFIEKHSLEQKKKTARISEALADFFSCRSWSGNIRELENIAERLVTLVPADRIQIEVTDLPPDLSTEFREYDTGGDGASLPQQIQDYERQIIESTLTECGWNQSAAARKLNIPEQTLRYRMHKLGISHNS
jgi:Nif-specific regulatory protein